MKEDIIASNIVLNLTIVCDITTSNSPTDLTPFILFTFICDYMCFVIDFSSFVLSSDFMVFFFFFFQAEDGIRDWSVTGVQTCALPISSRRRHTRLVSDWSSDVCSSDLSEEHTSELQSLTNLVCRLLLGVQTCALPIDRKSTRLNSSH